MSAGSPLNCAKRDRVVEASHPAAAEEGGDGDLARLAPQLVASFELDDRLELLELRIEFRTVRHDRQVEQARAHCPKAPIPFDGCAIGIAPRVRGVIEGAGIDDRPVHEVGAGIVRIFVGVENIADAKLADRDDDPVRGLRARELVDVGIDLLLFAAEIDRLPDEHAGNPCVGNRLADLVGFAAWKSGDAERAAQPEALVDLRIDPELRALPQLRARVKCHVPGFASLVGHEAVRDRDRASETGNAYWLR